MISLRVLGTVDLRTENGAPIRTVLVQPKRLGLLAYLCLTSPHGMQRRDVITSLFWPELDSERARSSLRTTLHRLRQWLGDVIDTRGSEELGVVPGMVRCDALEFEAACRDKNWSRALELYEGDLLHGFFIDAASNELQRWIDAERSRLRQLAVSAAWHVAEERERDGDLPAAIDVARRAVTWSPADESAVRRLIALHDRNGDRAGALAAYDAFSKRLREELDAEPSAETIALVDAVRERRSVDRRIVGDSASRNVDDVRRVESRSTFSWRSPRIAAIIAVPALVLLVGGLRSVARMSAASHEMIESDGTLNGVAAHLRGFLLQAALVAPRPMAEFSTAFDPLHGDAYVFGGNSGNQLFDEVAVVSSTRSVTGPTWTVLPIDGPKPSPRWMHSAIYDPASDRMVVFGGALGRAAPCANDVWILDNATRRRALAAWIEAHPNGAAPDPRGEHTATYLPRANRMIVFGGHNCIQRRTNDTWALVNPTDTKGKSEWRRVTTGEVVPPARSNHSAVYDAARDQLIVFGGMGINNETLDDVWILSPASSDRASWRKARVMGRQHPALAAHRAAWDPMSRQMIVFGGIPPGGGAVDELWFLEETGVDEYRWTRLEGMKPEPASRFSFGMAYDTAQDRLMLFAGQAEGAQFTDVWLLMNATGRLLKK